MALGSGVLRRRALANRLRESLLLLPTPMVVLAAVAERLLVPLDRRLAHSTETTPPITGAAQFRGPPGAVA